MQQKKTYNLEYSTKWSYHLESRREKQFPRQAKVKAAYQH